MSRDYIKLVLREHGYELKTIGGLTFAESRTGATLKRVLITSHSDLEDLAESLI